MTAVELREDALKVLIVEDNPGDAFLVGELLREIPHLRVETQVADTVAEARTLLERQSFDIILTDLDLPDSSGLETVARLLNNSQALPLVVLSGHDARSTAVDAIRLGAQDFLEKGLINSEALQRLLAHSLERHRLQRDLKINLENRNSASHRFVNLIGDLTDAVVVVDEAAVVKYVNAAAELLFGKDAEQLIGEAFQLPLDDKAPVELDLVTRSGEVRVAEIRVVETEWDGAPARLASLRDITERKRVERSMQVAQQAAETANLMKSQFLANMSHELRTPLNSIIGFSEIIHRESLGEAGNERYVEYAGDIHHSGQHLLSLINDLLDLSKAEAGRYEIVESEFDLEQLVRDAMRLVTSQVELKSQALGLEMACGTCLVTGGERQITQVLVNLLSNAIKFTPERGRISVCVRSEPRGSVVIDVEDSGIGIDPQDIPRLFNAYTQLGEQYLKGKHQGTGLGLALSQRLMELHDGILRIQSQPNEGTTASMILPGNRVHWAEAEPGLAQAANA